MGVQIILLTKFVHYHWLLTYFVTILANFNQYFHCYFQIRIFIIPKIKFNGILNHNVLNSDMGICQITSNKSWFLMIIYLFLSYIHLLWAFQVIYKSRSPNDYTYIYQSYPWTPTSLTQNLIILFEIVEFFLWEYYQVLYLDELFYYHIIFNMLIWFVLNKILFTKNQIFIIDQLAFISYM